ncbi:unnamed protein product, partial [Mesorhabditis spiculigera]
MFLWKPTEDPVLNRSLEEKGNLRKLARISHESTVLEDIKFDKPTIEEPKNGDCAIMDSTDSKWYAVDCSEAHGRICVEETKSCYNGWSYYAETDFCYYHGYNQTFEGGEEYCSNFGGHLASIHSDKENDYIKLLTYSKSCVQIVYGYVQGTTVLGGSLSERNRTAFWIDGTPADYTGNTCYHGGEPNTILMNSFPADCGRCPEGSWWINFESQGAEMYPDFVCKVAPFEGSRNQRK